MCAAVLFACSSNTPSGGDAPIDSGIPYEASDATNTRVDANALQGDDAGRGDDSSMSDEGAMSTDSALDAEPDVSIGLPGNDASIPDGGFSIDAPVIVTDSSAGDGSADGGAATGDAAVVPNPACAKPVNVPQFVYRDSNPPRTPQAHQCTPAEASELANDCQGDMNTGALSTQCTSDQSSITNACESCVFSHDFSPQWGPIVVATNGGSSLNGSLSENNLAGCIDTVTGIPSCGDEYIETYSCLDDACQLNDGDLCANENDANTQTCFDAAQNGTCNQHITITNECNDAIFMTYNAPLLARCFGNTSLIAYENEITEFCVSP
jgi:hypothetical protein